MRRGSVPMRVRRRQSDAKWRASVATCYDTLKHVIPDCDKISKRKISKALILQETEHHISNLENALSDILTDKARSRGKVVLYQTDQGLLEANLTDVKRDLAIKQQNMYLQNYGQRKRSNIPSDIEAGIVNLRLASCPLLVLPKEVLQHQVVPGSIIVPPEISEVKQESCDQVLVQQVPEAASRQGRLRTLSMLNTPSKPRPKRARHCVKLNSDEFEYYSPGEETPDKQWNSHVAQRHKYQINRAPVSQRTQVTPIKQSTGCGTTGFTPIKLPEEFSSPKYLSDISNVQTPCKTMNEPSMMDSPFTAICMKTFSPGSQEELDDGYEWSEQVGLTNLLCDETIDNMDLEDKDITKEEDLAKLNSRTPQNPWKPKHYQQAGEKGKKMKSMSFTSSGKETRPSTSQKKEAKCRRQLEKCFSDDKENSPAQGKNTLDTSCLDFDGYYLFYQYIAGTKHKKNILRDDLSNEVKQMWDEMGEDEKATFIAMAALGDSQSDSSLSDDLRELDVEPINREHENIYKQKTISLVPVKEEPQQILLPIRPITKSFSFLLPDCNQGHGHYQEVPVSQAIIYREPEQILVPEVCQMVTVSNTLEEAIVPEMPVTEDQEPVLRDIPWHHGIGHSVEVISEQESQDFHLVPELASLQSEKTMASDLGFIPLSNENSLDDEMSQQLFRSQVTADDLCEWKGDITPII